ncbi:MAG: hypothetical protein GX684_01555 [Ruminococcaceae bacterium]|nr:hypothetical protein [Oscillospiraceae bacterium]
MEEKDMYLENEEEKDILEDPELDEFILEMAKMMQAYDSMPAVVVPQKLASVLETQSIVKRIFSERDVLISCNLYEPYKSCGAVTLEGKKLNFGSPEEFMRAFDLCDNFEAFPLLNGNIQANFGFWGLAEPIV